MKTFELAPTPQLRALFTPDFAQELLSSLNTSAGVVFTVEAGKPDSFFRNAATRLRGLLAEVYGAHTAGLFTVREEIAASRLIIYRKDCRGAVFAPPTTAPEQLGESAASAGTGMKGEELGTEWMRGHYSGNTPLLTRLASPANRATYLALRDGGCLSPLFCKEAERLLELIAQQKQADKPTFVWDRVLEAFRSGSAPAPDHLAGLFRLKPSAIPAQAREELESFGIFLRVPANETGNAVAASSTAHSKCATTAEPEPEHFRSLQGARPTLVIMDELRVESPPPDPETDRINTA